MTDVAGLVERFWGIRPDHVAPLRGGMNSVTWLVECDGAGYIAKKVQAGDLPLLVGRCEVARTLAESGIVTGVHC